MAKNNNYTRVAMEMTDFVAWSQLVSSGAVLITLLYLAIQTKQTNSAIQANARQSQFELDLMSLFKLADNADLAAKIVSDRPLEEIDQMRLTYLWMATLRQVELMFIQYRNGVLDQSTWDTQRRVIAAMLVTPKMKNWWNVAGKLPFSPDFVAIVQQTLDENLVPPDYQEKMFTWDSA